MRTKTLASKLKKYAQHGEVPARRAVMELAGAPHDIYAVAKIRRTQ